MKPKKLHFQDTFYSKIYKEYLYKGPRGFLFDINHKLMECSIDSKTNAVCLDIGGGAKSKNVSDALEILQDDKSVKSVLINIFGGITRCDLVAEGIVDATREKSLPWKIAVRLDGTNAQEGREILKANPHENIVVVENMKEAARLAVSI